MNVEEILEKEIKRLSRINGKLEKCASKNNEINLDIYNQIRNNSVTILEMTKGTGVLIDKTLNKIVGLADQY